MPNTPDFDPKVHNELQTRYTLQTKSIYLELEGYEFFHSPYSLDESKEDRRFIGRERVLSRLRMILENSQTKSGAYLVTGFRGMGKTSVVRKVVRDLNRDYRERENKEDNRFLPIEVSLAQDNLREFDVFSLITRYFFRR